MCLLVEALFCTYLLAASNRFRVPACRWKLLAASGNNEGHATSSASIFCLISVTGVWRWDDLVVVFYDVSDTEAKENRDNFAQLAETTATRWWS